MENKTKILMVEHATFDIELIQHELKKGGIDFIAEVVQTEKEYAKAIESFLPDLILSDYSIPAFSGDTALKIRDELAPLVPFIFVSGTIGEEKSVEYIKNGVTDYALKDKLYTLVPKVNRALKEAKEKLHKIKAERALKFSEKRFRALTEHSADIILLTSEDGSIKYSSPSVEKVLGYSSHEFAKHNPRSIIHPDDIEDYIKSRNELLKTPDKTLNFTLRVKHKNDSWHWCDGTLTNLLKEPGVKAMVTNLKDVTEKKYAEENLIKSNRLYHFISQINQSIVQINNKESLLKKACSIALDIGKFKMAWIGLLNAEDKLEVINAQGEGNVADVAKKHSGIDVQNSLLQNTPVGKALRTGLYAVSNDVCNDPGMNMLKEDLLITGIKSNIAFPLKISNKVVGVFSFSSVTVNAFDDQEIKLLAEATSDISFALENFEKAERHKAAETRVVKTLVEKNSILESIGDGFFAVDENWVVTYWNQVAETALKVHRTEILNKNLWEIFSDGKNSISYKKYHEAVETNRVIDFEDYYPPLEKWYKISAYPSENGLSVYFKDVTEQKNREEEIALLAKRLQLATDSAGMGIWHWDIVNNNLAWDEGMYRLYKIDEKQLGSVYNGWISRLHPQDVVSVNEDIQNAITGKKEYDTDFRIVLNDSSIRYIKATGILERDTEGNALRMIGLNWDITELKEKEQQIRKSEVFNRSVINSLNAHLAVANDKGEIISVNEAWTRFARQNGETKMERTGIGSNYFKVCETASNTGDEIAAQVLQGMKDVLNKKIKDFYLEYPCHSPTEQRWFGLRVIKFESDEPLILLVHTNLTARILAEQERQKITDDLIQRNHGLEQFTYIVSHNLRAPVANIKGLSEMMEDESLSKDEIEIVAKDLSSTINKLDNVILDLNNILQLKKDAGEARGRVVFANLVNDIEESIHGMMLTENALIVTHFDEAPEMMTLKSYIHSIFYNLITNSIKYKRPDVQPIIEIESFRRNDKIELIFKDNGRGFDLKQKGDQVFGLYKRFHLDVEGKGMGLFMVKTQVETLGGKISLHSEINKGSEFKIEFANGI